MSCTQKNGVKRGLILLTTLAAGYCAFADYPVVSHRYAADPSAIEYNGRLYVYCSHDEENWTNSYNMTSIVCFSTDDLKNWTDHGVVFSAPSNTTWAGLAWAPSVIYKDSLFYLYFANGGGSIGVATSSVPTGPFRDARGSALINSATPGAYSPTQWYFDPCTFIDDDGQPYLYFGGQYPTNSRVIRLNTNLVAVTGSATPLETTNFFEAAYMHKLNGIYYLSYCTRPEAGMVIAYATSTNPTNGFVYRGTVLPNPPQNRWNNNHHSIVQFKGNWYIAYHNRAASLEQGLTNELGIYKRNICLDQLNHNADGTIQQVTPTVDGLPQLKHLDPYVRVEAETIGKQFGIKTDTCTEGGMMVIATTNGSWIRVRGVNFGTGASRFYVRLASSAAGGRIELRLGSLTNQLIGALDVPNTGGAQNWTTVTTAVTNASGVHDLYLRFTGTNTPLFNLNWWRFQQAGSAALGVPTTIEAEAGTLGAHWAISNYPSVTSITITSNMTANNPGNSNRIATYTVTFPAAGTYELYARIRVGPRTWDDDSFFYGNGFGVKSPTNPDDWILVNGLASAGFTNATDVVTGRGSAGSGVWKWVNLSQYTDTSSESPITFTVPAGSLTQIFQIGAREDGLEIDKVVFAPQGYFFTVADLDAGNPGQPPSITVLLDPTKTYQTIEGLGGAICFYNGWVTAHPYKQELYTNAFAGLNLSMLRLGNWFRYTNAPDMDAPEFVSNANRILGRPIRILMSSWAPPAFLKSNGKCGGGGTLATNAAGQFMYDEFGQYWYDALQAYRSNGVWPTWISIQNEPDWEADYDSCIFRPTEGIYNGTNYASYAKALEAVFRKITNLPSPPKILAPEVVHIRWNTLRDYCQTLNGALFYGVAYHLYGDSVDGTIDGYIPSLRESTNYFPAKPRFMTEYGVSNMIDAATLIHHCITEGRVSGFNYWNLIWPGVEGGLIQIEFPWDRSRWTNAPPGTPTQSRGYWLAPAYWAMKHFSYFVEQDSVRIGAACNNTNVRVSAYLTPLNARLVCVLINRAQASAIVALNPGSFPYISSAVYQTTSADVYIPGNTNRFVFVGELGQELVLPPESLTTVVLNMYIPLGRATDPFPANGALNVPCNTALAWTPGTNALLHAVYLGVNSNAVALAGPGAPEFRGFVTTNWFSPPGLDGSTTYFWRVDQIAGANTNIGVVWSFTTAPAPALKHRYSFNEIGGVVVADSAGGPAWNGTVFNGGTLAGGQLRLASASSQYVNLPAGIVSTLTNFTIATWVRLNSVANWVRIFDFGNNTTTNMFLTPQNGANGRLRFAITTTGASGEQRIDGTFGLSTGVWYHVAVTLDGNRGVLYVNGTPVGTNNSMTLRPASLGVTINNYIGRSQYAADPYLNAVLDEFRIYRVALSSSEIAAMYALGPNQLFSDEPPPLTGGLAEGGLTLTWPLANTGFILQARTNLTEGSWFNVTSPAPVIVGDRWQVTLPITNSPTMFFRLMK